MEWWHKLLLSLFYLSNVICNSVKYCSDWVTVQPGGSCWQISNTARLQIDMLMSMNPGIDCNTLWVGQRVCIAQSSNKPQCTRTYNVKSGDYCYKIWTENELSEQQMVEMNDGLNCDSLSVGQSICVSNDPKHSTPRVETTTRKFEPATTTTRASTRNNSQLENDNRPPLSSVEKQSDCVEYATVMQGYSCITIVQSYHLSLAEIQKEYDCNLLKIGDTVCVAKTFNCQHRYLAQNKDSCQSVGKTFKLTSQELEEMNTGLNCQNFEIGRRLCVWSAQERTLANMTCTDWRFVEKKSTCFELARQFSITVDEFRFLNPTMTCEGTVSKLAYVCVSGASSTRDCSSIQPVPRNNSITCSDLSQQFSMSIPHLMSLNPTLNCDKLNQTDQVCIGRGPYRALECTDYMRVIPEFDTCQKIQIETGLSLEQLQSFNPLINCNQALKWGNLVCTANLGMDTGTAQQIVVDSLKSLCMCSDECGNEKAVIIKLCFCQDIELLVYCQALAVKRFHDNEIRLSQEDDYNRGKRAVGCSFITPYSGQSMLDLMMGAKNQCWGGGCSIPVGFFEANLDASLCFPTVEFIEATDQVVVCLNQKDDCDAANPNDAGALKLLARRSVDSSLKFCAIGSNLVKKLLAADAGLCFDIVSVNYFGLVGKLNVGSALNLVVFKLSGGASIKVHDSAFPNICEDVEMECEDYCKWRDWPNGQAYGYIQGILFSVFGWEGIKIFDESFNEPDKLGCEVGEKAAVILRNDRTCENPADRNVWRCCWNKDDNECTFEVMEQERGFSFKPHILGRTVFTCEFVDKDIDNIDFDKIGFDVYGGTSKNKGKKNFYYVAKNDGMYFGTVKYQEDRLIKSWNNPCEESKQNDNNVDRTGQKEPSGQSSVPAVSCGKRIVGYYTGWGDREITENQLRKLTHVVFAFVAIRADSTVDFGPVSEDDPGPEAGVKAKRRFLDMKACSVNAGVQILFAVGGWDNSQYFASTAADSGRRATFINSCASFIETYGIDGVDLDWEYPAEKGGDKNNHVALMREMRQKLDQMANSQGRRSKYLITMASAAGEWNLREGYDLNGILQYADFINVMTYDYYGAWASKWGASTGPPSPLYFGSLKGFSGKLNADFTMKFYACKTNQKEKLNMGVPFYGRFWRNVEDPIRGEDGMWRTAREVGGKFDGGYVAWRNLEKEGWNKGAATWHDKTKTPYIFNAGARMFLGFENERSLQEKMSYAIDKSLGGIMVWALDLDDEADTLLNLVSNTNLCSGGGGGSAYVCNPIDDVRWWTPENSDESIQGQCGKSAKLINGYYPVCDPDDPGFSCCGAAGYCGSEEEYCGCETCVDYRKNPMDIIKEPVRPSREVQWYSMSDPDGKRGRCGKDVPMLHGKMAICNPDDDSKHCCSNGGYCGTGKEYCQCDGCVDYRKK